MQIPHEIDAAGVTSQRQVEAAQSVARHRVRTALQHDRRRLKRLHTLPHNLQVSLFIDTNRLENVLVGLVIHSVLQRDIYRVVLSLAQTHVRHVPRAWEVVPILVEGNRHHAVRQVKCLFHAVSVVDINVDVHHTGIYSTVI